MELARAEQLAKELMTKHGVGHIEFQWMNTKRMLGCIQTQRIGKTVNYQRLKLSRAYVKMNDEASVTDTILHEIAHLLAGVENGHNHVWKAKCVEIGARPEEFATDKDVNLAWKYEVICTTCGTVFKRLFAATRKDYSRYGCPCCGFSRGKIAVVEVTAKK